VKVAKKKAQPATGGNLPGTVAEPSPSGARRWQVCLTGNDFAAIAFLREKYLYSTDTEPLRYALRQQVARDAAGQEAERSRRLAGTVSLMDKRWTPEANDARAALRRANRAVEEAEESGKGKRAAQALLLAAQQQADRATGGVRQWSCWMRPADFDNMRKIQGRWGMAHEAEAVRMALRAQAEIDGFEPKGGW
jgi:hypothetical protein